MSALRQVLKPADFVKVQPGLDKAAVRRLLGRPATTARYELKPDEEHWEWRWLDGTQSKLFSVTFDRDGRVVSTAVSDDRRNEQTGR
jgi:outer membrane protein assembly factor BamE (lipoprotein component of BamABCDE complex)